MPPSARPGTVSGDDLLRSPTSFKNQFLASCTMPSTSAALLRVRRLKGIGTAFSGPLFTSSTLTPIVCEQLATSAHWKMTPTEPVTVLP